MIGSALVGLLAGAITWSLMTYDLNYASPLTVGISSTAVFLVVALTLLASRLARCVVALVTVTMATCRGRVALCLVVAHLLLGGPVIGVARNAAETVRSMTCSTELALNRCAGQKNTR